MELITSASKFVDWFRMKVPGAREISLDDVRLLTECGLIKRCGFYGNADLQTVIGILRYEKLREKRTEQQEYCITLFHFKWSKFEEFVLIVYILGN